MSSEVFTLFTINWAAAKCWSVLVSYVVGTLCKHNLYPKQYKRGSCVIVYLADRIRLYMASYSLNVNNSFEVL